MNYTYQTTNQTQHHPNNQTNDTKAGFISKFRNRSTSFVLSSITNFYTSSIPKNLYVVWWTISYISSIYRNLLPTPICKAFLKASPYIFLINLYYSEWVIGNRRTPVYVKYFANIWNLQFRQYEHAKLQWLHFIAMQHKNILYTKKKWQVQYLQQY